MSSVNISITKDVYDMLKRLKKEDESFSDIIYNLASQKDITKFYGILKDSKEDLESVEKEVQKIRKQKWRGPDL